MIRVTCACGRAHQWREIEINAPVACPGCGREMAAVSAEQLTEGAGEGDFDARLVISSPSPEEPERQMFLGGVLEISVGRLPDNQVQIDSQSVSRKHCTLHRVDFGPSRWKLVDENSRAGVFVNGTRVLEHELNEGDVIRLGEHEVRFSNAPMAALAAPAEAGDADALLGATGNICPSCDAHLKAKAKICVACGIHVPSGRPLLTSHEVDENYLYEYSESMIRLVSWLVWVTPMPIPLASEAYGTKKPWTIRVVAALTVLVSVWFFFYYSQTTGRGNTLMLWAPSRAAAADASNASGIPDRVIEMLYREADAGERAELKRRQDELKAEGMSDKEARRKAMEQYLESIGLDPEDLRGPPRGEFKPWQLLTHALLHDPGGIFGFLGHLGGNMLFLLVFGTRVNALIGNVATAIIYPVLAIAAALIHIVMSQPLGAMLGASGAIQGLAGMYLILFPVHRVYCAMWIRFRWHLGMKIFTLRGFWVLLIYFAYDAVMVALRAESGTAHWAHIGGFLTGVVIALGILASRQFNSRGGDLLSVMLGRHAWPIIGKPSRWNQQPVTA
jgi:membrane associated rhomboid family serine protease